MVTYGGRSVAKKGPRAARSDRNSTRTCQGVPRKRGGRCTSRRRRGRQARRSRPPVERRRGRRSRSFRTASTARSGSALHAGSAEQVVANLHREGGLAIGRRLRDRIDEAPPRLRGVV